MQGRAILGIGLLLIVFTVPIVAQSLPAELKTTNTASVAGSLRTNDDRPVANARVEVRDLNTGAMISSTYTSENGMFELYNIQVGSYELVATSGVDESKERVDVAAMNPPVTLRINTHTVAPDGSATVSVSKLSVPEKAQKEYEKGAEAFQKNKMDDSRKHIERALSIYPNYAEALVIRGVLFANEKNVASAIEDLQAAIKADPNYGMAYIAMGAVLNEQHNFGDAKRSLERGISLSPNSWQGYFEMSKAAMGSSDYEAALKNVERAHSIVKDDYPPLHLIKAHALLGLKQYEPAIAELEEYLSREPTSPNAQYARSALDQAKAFMATNTGSK